MKFGQVIEYKKRFFFYFKYHSENETGRLVPDLLFFKNALYDVKEYSPQLGILQKQAV